MANPHNIKAVLVTGAASGIGRETAKLFAEKGYRVALLDLEATKLKSVEDELAHQELGHKSYVADVSSSKALTAAFQEIESAFGALDAAVNNAGIENAQRKFLELTENDFDKVMNVNLKGVFLCLQQELAIMSKVGKGSIVNVSSILGKVGSPGLSIYSATKHGVLGLTKSLAIEYGRKGIRINAICPGGVETALIQRGREMSPKAVEAAEKLHPIGRFAQPNEIANAIYWLCSDDSSFVHGTGLTIDGGYTAG